ncbi:hypothetical protein [Pseudotabrizicola algicola]|uniref:DUF2793 domain-containing protein n=1 Tax=Pseudotabrizicola algicola TaxID=2709381 RepID=A0A6B3RMV0_9RHOB|nr:hypothetical protein [Pseudotabrizicola algicola]NEX46526.1 hypothetical protein [Pseudotabrizicola algicola]
MRVSIGCGIASVQSLRPARTPRSLFRPGDLGVWLDPGDLATLTQDPAGMVPVFAPGQAVGRIRDKSGNNIHALQASADQRPLYARRPLGGRRNLLVMTDNLIGWTPQGTPDTSADGSLGGEPAFRLTDNNTAQWEAGILTLPSSGQVAGVYTLSVRVKKEVSALSAASARLNIFDGTSSQSAGFVLNTVTGATMATASWIYGSRVIAVDDMQDYWQVKMTFTLDAGHAVTSFAIFPAHHALSGSSSSAINTGSNTWAAPQLELGGVATPYQRVTSAADITEAGQPHRFALLNDQINDAMLVTLPAGNYTVASATDAGVVIQAGQPISGAFAIPGPARLYACLIINRTLSAEETARLTAWFNAKRP